MKLESIMCKWTQPFRGTDCRTSPKSLSSAQAASLGSAGSERAQKCLQGEHLVGCTLPTVCSSGIFWGRKGGGSAAVCDRNLAHPFAQYR